MVEKPEGVLVVAARRTWRRISNRTYSLCSVWVSPHDVRNAWVGGPRERNMQRGYHDYVLVGYYNRSATADDIINDVLHEAAQRGWL